MTDVSQTSGTVPATGQGSEQVESAVSQGTAYEVIRKRLSDQGNQLETLAQNLNQARLQEFGSTELNIIGRTRVRTDNNCLARDIVRVGDYLLFGYNVFIGLKQTTSVSDVFSLYRLVEGEDALDMEPVSPQNTFLGDARFQSDFNELYTYYKNTTLTQLRVKEGRLLAAFQIGERLTDIRVFRWSVSADGKQIEYIDNRGERDIELPPAWDFEWLAVEREAIVDGRHPHVNILDTIFVDTIEGDLTIKVENNTRSGKGIYAEPVVDPNQSLDDADFFFAEIGQLILLRIKPYQEEHWRHLVFNRLNESVVRIDAIGDSCQQLPEDHGIVFPGGYYLQTGEYKTFDEPHKGLRFRRAIRSPNGEDVLYVHYQPEAGVVALYPYNMIEKALRNPVYGHGYGLFEDGRMVVFSADEEPTRVHPMQIWQSPFFSDVHASQAQQSQSFYGRIGNAELVRGISDLFSVVQLIRSPNAASAHYHELCKYASRLFDQYYWLSDASLEEIHDTLKAIIESGELVLDEYEKVQSIRKSSQKALQEAEQSVAALIKQLQPDAWTTPQPYMNAMLDIRKLRGHLLTILEYRYINQDRIRELDTDLEKQQDVIADRTIEFLAEEKSLQPFYDDLEHLEKQVAETEIKSELTPLLEKLEALSDGLDALTETVSAITSAEATVRTGVIERISTLFAHLNQARARTQNKLKSLGYNEALAQFSAQFKLLSQSMTSGLSMSTSPDRCDEQLAKLMNQLQELESQFGEYDEFLADILEKREEIFESFESHKQGLLDEQQRRAQTLHDAAKRIIDGVRKRSQKFKTEEELNTFFSSDPLLNKLKQLSQQLRDLDDAVKADDVDAQLKGVKDQAVRSLRDKSDIYEDDGKVIKLGPRHRFSVNTQDLDLTLLPRGEELYFHLSGTDFYEACEIEGLQGTQAYWSMAMPSEAEQVSRAEYLAYSVLRAAERNQEELSITQLMQARNEREQLLALLRRYAEPRYKEGYERGIHDHDAGLLLESLLPQYELADLLRFDPLARAWATLYWAEVQGLNVQKQWPLRAQSALQMSNLFGSDSAFNELWLEVTEQLQSFLLGNGVQDAEQFSGRSARYLILELAKPVLEFSVTRASQTLMENLQRALKNANAQSVFEENIRALHKSPGKAWRYVEGWLSAWLLQQKDQSLQPYIPEAVARILVDGRLAWKARELNLELRVDGLLSSHGNIENGSLTLRLDEFLLRMEHHQTVVVPAYQHYLAQRHEAVESEKKRLRLDQFKARPLSSFVRNKLINQSYLPLIGDNLAKQMGTVGDKKRSDLMGLLMMISPPGYGKTTLMEYVANRLGLIFMKINCPSLGHEVDSLDPQQAPNATARQELEKLNLGLEMGNNVMLYLDDIQHTNPEFLQKFISLCDGTRRIEGVWKGQTKTYDMRGKKFCVVMAGNPYTESGELFKIPDMLANRADIYNLGDVLSGTEEVFALSYIENSMTSNPVLAPLATRDMADFYLFVDMAKGRAVNESEFKHPYSAAESREIVETLKKLFVVQAVVLKVNQQYIESAAQDERFRTEPPFKLQGSYRNMNKLAEKVTPVMTDSELEQLLNDHYLGESQLLTTGTEANLLKLKELRGVLNPAETQRWEAIKQEFRRLKQIGGDDADVGVRVVSQLNAMSQGIEKAVAALSSRPDTQASSHHNEALQQSLQSIADAMAKMTTHVEVVNQPVPGIDLLLKGLVSTLEGSIFPLVKAMDGKIDLDLKTHHKMGAILDQLRTLEASMLRMKHTSRASSGNAGKEE
ncbi:MAG: DNA repair protein [Pseudomonadales bacterium]|nr:DNA repair protein [Pseudomonadales bacterium]